MSKPDIKISVISDVHITHYGDGAKDFEKALAFHAKHHPNSDLYLFPGDTIYQLDDGQHSVCNNIYTENYDMMLELVDKYIPTETPKLFVVGNHEFPQCNTDPDLTKKALTVWTDKIGQPALEYTIVNGFHIIKYPITSWAMEPNEENEAWAMNALESAISLGSDNNRPVFFVSHDAIPNTVGMSGNGSGSFTEKFRLFLEKHPQIVHIAGHHHAVINDDKAIYQKGACYISAPVCAVGYICAEGCDYLNPPVFGFSQSITIEVTGSKVTVHKFDHTTETEIGTPWAFDIADAKRGEYAYGDNFRANAPAAAFADSACVSAEIKENSLFVTVNQAFDTTDVICEYYQIEVTDEQGAVTLKKRVWTDFYNLMHNEPMAKTITYDIGKIAPGNYTVSVTPLNCFYKGENSIFCKISV